MKFSGRIAVIFFAAILFVSAAYPQAAREGRLIREVVHAATVAGRPAGESAERNVSIYLPPSYDTSTSKRYPVVYLLHGITDRDTTWTRPWTSTDDGYTAL